MALFKGLRMVGCFEKKRGREEKSSCRQSDADRAGWWDVLRKNKGGRGEMILQAIRCRSELSIYAREGYASHDPYVFICNTVTTRLVSMNSCVRNDIFNSCLIKAF